MLLHINMYTSVASINFTGDKSFLRIHHVELVHAALQHFQRIPYDAELFHLSIVCHPVNIIELN